MVELGSSKINCVDEFLDKVPATSGVKRDSGGRSARPNRWHNESQRYYTPVLYVLITDTSGLGDVN